MLHANVQILPAGAVWVRKVMGMKKTKRSDSPDALLKKLAVSSPNDAVKLLFLDAEELDTLDGLDLSLLTEMKRSANGAVEIKLVNKLDVIRELYELKRAENSEAAAGQSFYAALDKAADKLTEADDAV